MNRSRRFKQKKAYSLVEVVVSLGIIGIIMTMLFSVLILSLQITFKILARSVVREEVANITGLISRDVRNADHLGACGGGTDSCEVIQGGNRYFWYKCGERICKDKVDSGVTTNVFTSTENLRFSHFIFDSGFSDPNNKSRQNIIITIVGEHTNPSFNVKNVIKQTSVSTRNYEL